jgi:hypothetical protein
MMMAIMTAREIEERLFVLAEIEQAVNLEVADLEYSLSLMAAEIKVAKDGIATLRDRVKTDFLAHVEAGGDPEINPSITFKRTKKFVYDKKAALEFVLANELPYTRIETELDANSFKKACQDGTVDYPGGEAVNVPSVAIGKLGHLLILAESKFEE